jgi:hypothetical protein
MFFELGGDRRLAQCASTVTLGGTWTGMEPSTIAFSADGGNIVTGIRWSSWNHVNAVGQGTYQAAVPIASTVQRCHTRR